MLKITFNKNKSKHFNKAIEIIKEYGGTFDGELAILEIPSWEMPMAYESLSPLLGLIQNWTSLKTSYNGKPVNTYKALFSSWQLLNYCSQEKHKFGDSMHCWIDTDNEGWGCHKLRGYPSRLVLGKGNYNENSRYWYNFGHFDENKNWIIDKNRLFEALKRKIDRDYLDICPHFSEEKIKKAIDSLPDMLLVDGVHFTYYIPVGESQPTNIRHLTQSGVHIIYEAHVSLKNRMDLFKIGQNLTIPNSLFKNCTGNN